MIRVWVLFSSIFIFFFFLKHLQILHLQASKTSDDDVMRSPLWFRAEAVLHVHSTFSLSLTPHSSMTGRQLKQRFLCCILQFSAQCIRVYSNLPTWNTRTKPRVGWSDISSSLSHTQILHFLLQQPRLLTCSAVRCNTCTPSTVPLANLL